MGSILVAFRAGIWLASKVTASRIEQVIDSWLAPHRLARLLCARITKQSAIRVL